MKRATLSPLASRHRPRRSPRVSSCGAGFTPAIPHTMPHAPTGSAARPKATLRTLATGRATRHAYFNALCALVSPAR